MIRVARTLVGVNKIFKIVFQGLKVENCDHIFKLRVTESSFISWIKATVEKFSTLSP